MAVALVGGRGSAEGEGGALGGGRGFLLTGEAVMLTGEAVALTREAVMLRGEAVRWIPAGDTGPEMTSASDGLGGRGRGRGTCRSREASGPLVRRHVDLRPDFGGDRKPHAIPRSTWSWT